MSERLKTIMAVLGLMGVVVAGFAIYDRYWQHAKPNIPRFEKKEGHGRSAPMEIRGLDKSADDLVGFLHRNLQKRIYLDISFIPQSGIDGIAIHPAAPPLGNQSFELTFVGDCLSHPVSRKDPINKSRCNGITIHLDPTRDVEQQVFIVFGAVFEVRGYFLDDFIETHMGFQFISLKPISAQQILT